MTSCRAWTVVRAIYWWGANFGISWAEKGYTAKVLEWASTGMRTNTDFSALLENKRLSIVEEWGEKYGTGLARINEVLERYL